MSSWRQQSAQRAKLQHDLADAQMLVTLSPDSDPELLTSVGCRFDPGQGRRRVAGGITAEDDVAAQWRDDSGGCRLDRRPHTTGQLSLGQQHP